MKNDKSENETKTVKAIVKSDGGRFYWKKATEVGKYLIVSDTVGNLTSIDTTDNSVVQTKKQKLHFQEAWLMTQHIAKYILLVE